jgi:Ca2+-dependent lipid-binding protein
VAFVSKPSITYHLESVGVAVSSVPGLADWLNKTITDVLYGILLWPNKISVPIIGEEQVIH